MLRLMSNLSARPNEQPVRHLYPMDKDQGRYHAQLLRAAADLILAGEPAAWYRPGGGERLGGVAYLFDEAAFSAASIAVRKRVEAGDEDYVIRVEPKETTKPYGYRKRR
jgi:hypothetical protein